MGLFLKNINEAYFGKTKEILAAEAQLDKFRNKYMDRYVFNMKVNSDPDLLEFDRMMEKIFGFGCFTMHVHNQAMANAFTQSIDCRIDYDNLSSNIVADKKGFRFKPEYDYACLCGIYSGIIFNPDFITGEVMAIILHEIGHNFNSAINGNNGTLTKAYMSIIAIDSILSFNLQNITVVAKASNAYRKFADKTGKKMREENSAIIYLYDAFIQAINILKYCGGVVNDAIRILSLGTSTVILTALNLAKSVFVYIRNPISALFRVFGIKVGYSAEESADNFASMYGYSAELATGLGKLNTKAGNSSSALMSAFDKIPIVSNIMHINEIPAHLMIAIMDEHPHTINRIKDQIDMLNKELDKEDIDPKMVKYIKSDIKSLEAALDNLTDTANAIDDPYIGEKFYNKMVSKCTNVKGKLFGGKFKFEEYDRAFRNNSK